MALREIGAKLTLDGEQEWNRQMKNADRALSTLKSEMAATSAEFSGQANTLDALEAKQKLQIEQVDQQREKVRALGEAIADATSMYGENSAQVDKLTQKYNYAKASLSNMERALSETEGYLDEARSSADGCATSIDEFGKKAKDAGGKAGEAAGNINDLDDAESKAAGSADDLLEGLKNLTGIDLKGLASGLSVAGIAAGFKKAYDWAENLVTETDEVRGKMAALEANANQAGVTMDQTITEALRTAYGACGDMDASLQAVSDLLMAGYDGAGMLSILEDLSAAVEAFPDSFKIESLADSLQKTLDTGQAQGQFRDMLERLGVDVEDFETKLAECNTQAEQQIVVLDTLSTSSLPDLAKELEETREYSKRLKDAQFDLEQANINLAKSFEPVVTQVTEARAQLANFLSDELRLKQLGGSYSEADDILHAVNVGGLNVDLNELIQLLEEAGLTFGTLGPAALDAGMSVGAFVAQLHVDHMARAWEETQALAEEETAEAEAAQEAARAHEEAAAAMEGANAKAEEAMADLEALQAVYDNIRSGIDNVANGFRDLSGSAEQYKTSVSDMIDALQSQIDYMDTYAENLEKAKEMGLSDALIEEFSDGSEQSAAYLAALVESSEEDITFLNAKFAEVEQGKQDFVDTVADCLPGFSQTMDDIQARLEQAVAEWNQSAAATEAGQLTVDGLCTGLSYGYARLFALGQQMGNAVMAGYKSATEQHSPSRAMARLMDYTVEGAVNQGERRLGDLRAVGEDMGQSVLTGYRRTAEASAAILRAESPGLASAAAEGGAGGQGGENEVLTLLRTYLPDIQKVANMQLVTETGALIGATVAGLDEALGERMAAMERGLSQ